ncbi:carboxyl-terminal processing protease [Oxalobacteraceae bacterium GrIS 1.11]
MKKIVCASILTATLTACGGGGNPGTCKGSDAVCHPVAAAPATTATSAGAGAGYTAPLQLASASVAHQCVAPRPSGMIDPYTQQPYGDVQGSLTAEKQWIRAFVNETYLWYQDVVDLDPALFIPGATVAYTEPSNNSERKMALSSNFDAVNAYFNSQRSMQTTNSGKPKDQFHFTYRTDEWQALSNSGNSVGFGMQVALVSSAPPRKAVVAYTEPGSPASTGNVARGAQLISVNGVAIADGDPAPLNEALFAPIAGKQYNFQVLDQGSAAPRNVTLSAGNVTSTPVQNAGTLPAPYGNVGYIQFNDHIATAESQLIAAVTTLKANNGGKGVDDLVLDLRYNGGGLLDIASEMAYMIAGPNATASKNFETASFNNKNPFGVNAGAGTPFHNVTQGFSTTAGQALPQLGLGRVFVITGNGTCSASEAIMNGLKGAGIQVIQIGNTTCGKPYGFIPQDNCGVTYFTIQFKGVNHLGFGDYADGFIPAGTGATANNLPGCVVPDDFTKPMGDITEARLAAALQYRHDGTCPVPASGYNKVAAARRDAVLGRSTLRENRFFLPRLGAPR